MQYYYVNLGRWAENIIGPFDTTEAAERYIRGMKHWSGDQRPTVVTIASPKKTFVLEWAQDGLIYQVRVRATTCDEAKDIANQHGIAERRFLCFADTEG